MTYWPDTHKNLIRSQDFLTLALNRAAS